jgi:ParB family chromosome partitioning protein
VAAGVLSAGHARALLGLGDPEAKDRLALRIVAEGLSVRAVEEIVAMGGDEVPKPRRAVMKEPADPALSELAERLSDAFETRVRVELGRRKGKIVKGKIVVEFASVEDLERIVSTMSVDLPGDGRA